MGVTRLLALGMSELRRMRLGRQEREAGRGATEKEMGGIAVFFNILFSFLLLYDH